MPIVLLSQQARLSSRRAVATTRSITTSEEAFRHETTETFSRERLSNCEDDPAEGAALNEVTQSICRLSQRERLCHDGLDRTGLK